MVSIKSKSIDEISAMADQRLPVPGADVAWLVKRVRELEEALLLEREIRKKGLLNCTNAELIRRNMLTASALRSSSSEDLAKADQEDPA